MDDITEFYAWTRQQADALRRRAGDEIDWDAVADEIEALGRSEKREVGSRLATLLQRLLLWHYQPERRSGIWRSSIREARDEIAELVVDNPSLVRYPKERLARAFEIARLRALDEAGLLHLPEVCPWPIDDVLCQDFLPN